MGVLGQIIKMLLKRWVLAPLGKTKNNGIKSKIYDIYLWSDNNYMRAGERVEN